MKRRDLFKWAGAATAGLVASRIGAAPPAQSPAVGGVGAGTADLAQGSASPPAAGEALASAPEASAGPGLASGPRARRLNILLLVTDQERALQDLPAQLPLPGHAWLRQSGMRLGNFHVNTTPCSPSRSVMVTGRHTQQTRITANLGLPPFRELSTDLPTLGHRLRQEGYYTAYKGKWHLSQIPEAGNLTYGVVDTTERALEPYGFGDFNYGGDPHGAPLTGFLHDKLIASDAVSWLHEVPARLDGQPWFLAVNFVNPHDVMFYRSGAHQEATRRRANFLGPLTAGPRGGVYETYWDLPLPRSFHAEDLRRKPWAQQADATLCNAIYGHLDPDDTAAWQGLQSYYFNCIRDVDQSLMQVLHALEQSGQLDDTIVVLTADHGEMAGAHRLRQKGPHMYRENTRVNFIVRHPDLRQGFDNPALGSSVDLVPTLLEWAGVGSAALAERHADLAGVSLAACLNGPDRRSERDARGHLFNYGVVMYIDPEFTIEMIGHQDAVTPASLVLESLRQLKAGPDLSHRALFRGIHDGRYKFARYFAPNDHHRPTDFETLLARNDLELYDTLEDPDELVNLASDPGGQRSLIESLNGRLDALIRTEVGVDDGSEHPGPGWLYRS